MMISEVMDANPKKGPGNFFVDPRLACRRSFYPGIDKGC